MTEMPPELERLAGEVRGRSWVVAKRVVVSKVGSVGRGERFDDDVADAVFLRLQRTALVGRYDSEAAVFALGRGARRLEGDGTVTLYRSCPRGGGIRPGDFAAGTPHEAGFYRHGGNVVQSRTVPMADVIAVEGSTGGGREFVYLPRGHVPTEPRPAFPSFAAFHAAANAPEPEPETAPAGP